MNRPPRAAARAMVVACAVAAAGSLLPACAATSDAGGGSAAPVASLPAASPGQAPWLAPQAEFTDYNSRLGNNRVASETALKVGRDLYRSQGFWEVYVATEPSSLQPSYDVNDPTTLTRASRGVSALALIMATESVQATRAFSAGGTSHEKAQLSDLVQQLRTMFPAVQTIDFQVFFGENNLHARARYQGGRLDYRAVNP